MPVHHSPERLKDIARDIGVSGSPVLHVHVPHSSTPRDQPAHVHQSSLKDKTLPVDDPGDGDTATTGAAGDGSHGGKVVGKLDQGMYRPFGTCSRSSSDTSSDAEYCKGGPSNPVCGMEVKDGDMGVQCSTCKHWFHSKCQAISKTAYNALVKHKVFSWHCSGCKPGLGKKPRSDAGC